MKTRIEVHIDPEQVKSLDLIAGKEGRSRKNLCETLILTYIKKCMQPAVAEPIVITNFKK